MKNFKSIISIILTLTFCVSTVALAANFNYDVAPDGTNPQVNEGRMSIVDLNAQTPTVANVAMATANTEYSYTIPDQTTKIMFKLRSQAASTKIAFTSTESGTTYLTVPANTTLILDDVFFVSKILYFQSPTASMTAEIIAFN